MLVWMMERGCVVRIGVPQASLHALCDQAALKLGHRPKNGEDHLARWRAGVHLLRQRDEFDAQHAKRLEGAEQMGNGTGEAVKTPHNDGVESAAVGKREAADKLEAYNRENIFRMAENADTGYLQNPLQ